jgi:acetyl esterase
MTEHRGEMLGVVGLQYSNPEGGPLCGDLYRPDDTETLPAVILIHGGSFIEGNRKSMASVGRGLVEAGFVAFTIDYRLAPEFLFPAPVEDAKSAAEFLKDHAEEYGVDGSKIGVLGSSAGGTIAALLATEDPPPVSAAVIYSGAFDFTKKTTSGPSEAEKEGIKLSECEGTKQECNQYYEELSPVFHVTPNTAPMLMFNSTSEQALVQQPQEMAQKLEAAGVPHELIIFEGSQHGLAYQSKAMPQTIDWFEQRLE